MSEEAKKRYDRDDRIVALAERLYAIARGSRREVPIDPLFALAWDDLRDEERTLYVTLVRGGYDIAGSL